LVFILRSKKCNVRKTSKAVLTAVILECGFISDGRNFCIKLCVYTLTLRIVRKRLLQFMNRMLNRRSFLSRSARVQLGKNRRKVHVL